jgi:hypothetical protein
MTELEWKIKVLLEALPVRCPYYRGEYDDCEAMSLVDSITSSHMTLNCFGNIGDCDLPETFRKEE